MERRLAAIVCADVAGYSRMMGADEAGTHATFKAHRTAIYPIILNHGGRLVKNTGDGFLLEFPSIVGAIEAAVAMQMVMEERNEHLPADRITLKQLMEHRSGLGDFFDEPISSYSSGMVLRLGFSVAMQVEPEILLIDEVLAVGDAEFQKKSGDALRARIHGGTTVVIVSQSNTQIRELCDCALWIDRGASKMLGGVDEVLAAYRHARESGEAA